MAVSEAVFDTTATGETGKVCTYCRKIERLEWDQDHSVDKIEMLIAHHLTYKSLSESSESGCILCTFLKKSLLELGDSVDSNFDFKVDEDKGRFVLAVVKLFGFAQPGVVFVRLNGPMDLRSKRIPTFQLLEPHGSSLDGYDAQSARPNLGLVKEWLSDCLENHPHCGQRQSDVYPSRLLSIDPSTNGNVKLIRLVENADRSSLYVALSHCWGQVQPLRTTTANLDTHLDDGIPFSDLPRSFQDAVTTASEIGCHNVWIDSLCIIQDSTGDWERECPRMADIYANALCTIAAGDASNPSVGFLHDYPSSSRYRLSGGITLRFVQDPRCLVDPTLNTALISARAWTLQERELSRRLIWFLNDRTWWKCDSMMRSDDVHTDIIPMYDDSAQLAEARRAVLRRGILNNSSASLYYDMWRDIVMDFSSCRLTHESDRLPALSGMASLFAASLDDEYVAGIWKGDIWKSLLWIRSLDFIKQKNNARIWPPGSKQPPRRYQAPSWSWASINGPVDFIEPHEAVQQISVQAVDVRVKGLDPFGHVESAQLLVTGRLIGISLPGFDQQALLNQFGPNAYVHLDYEEHIRESDEHGVDIFLLQIVRDVRYFERSEPLRWRALALERVSSRFDDAFRRIGVVNGEDGPDLDFQGSTVKTIKLI